MPRRCQQAFWKENDRASVITIFGNPSSDSNERPLLSCIVLWQEFDSVGGGQIPASGGLDGGKYAAGNVVIRANRSEGSDGVNGVW